LNQLGLILRGPEISDLGAVSKEEATAAAGGESSGL